MRTQAHIEKVVSVYPIAGAEAVEMCQVLDYHVVVKKSDGFKVGDLVVYIEIDSKLPDGMPREKMLELRQLKKDLLATSKMDRAPIQAKIDEVLKTNIYPEFEFLRTKKFEIHTLKFGSLGVYSLGIIFPLSLIGAFLERQQVATILSPEQMKETNEKYVSSLKEGTDVSDVLKVLKIEEDEDDAIDETDPKVSMSKLEKRLMTFRVYRYARKKFDKIMRPKHSGDWPKFLPSKSDLDGIQKVYSRVYPRLKGKRLILTEKMEGTNTSVLTRTDTVLKFFKRRKVYVCSHKVMKRKRDRSMHWRGVSYLELDKKIQAIPGHFMVRGELCGPGISCGARNIYKLTEVRFFVFNVYNMDTNKALTFDEMEEFCVEYGFETTPVVSRDFVLPDTVQETIAVAHGPSAINPEVLREGVVLLDPETGETYKIRDPAYLDLHSKTRLKTLEEKSE